MDIWLKMGVFGLLAYFYLFYKILKLGWNNNQNKIILGGILGMVSLFVVHFFTPYLNHPLGIGYVLLISVIYEVLYLHKNKKRC